MNGGTGFTTSDLFLVGSDGGDWFTTTTVDVDLLDRLRTGTETSVCDLDAALALIEQVTDDLIGYGTSGQTDLTNEEMRLAIRTLTRVMDRLGLSLKLPFRDYDTFRRYWVAIGAHGSWQGRRDIVHGLLDDVTDRLYLMQDEHPVAHIPEVALNALDSAEAILDHLRRLNSSVERDPRLAVSVAKDLIESTAKLVLGTQQVAFDASEDLPRLAYLAQMTLRLHPKALNAEAPGSLKPLLGSLSGLVQGLAELRNDVGVGHGRRSVPTWVRPRHARLAAGLATTWCSLLLETLGDPQAPWHTTNPLYRDPTDESVTWYADLRLLVPLSKGVLLARKSGGPAFDADWLMRFAVGIAHKFSRPAVDDVLSTELPVAINAYVKNIGPTNKVFAATEEVRLLVTQGGWTSPGTGAQVVVVVDRSVLTKARSVWTDWEPPVRKKLSTRGVKLGATVVTTATNLKASIYRQTSALRIEALGPPLWA